MSKLNIKHVATPIALALGMIATSAYAVEVGGVEVHGYGHAAYFQTNDNEYSSADKNGSWDDNLLSLLFVAKIDDKSKVWVQLHNTTEISHLDWAFVDYQVNSNLIVRGGQIKMPMGLFNEVIDSRFLHQSTLAPMIYQEAAEMVDENFRGVNATYSHDAGAGSLTWNGYVGAIARADDTPADLKYQRMVGGGITYKTPIDGLKLVATAFNSRMRDTTLETTTYKTTRILSLDYTGGNWDVKSEYATSSTTDAASKKSYYVQAGYELNDKWTPFIRYDYMCTDRSQCSDDLYRQKTTSIGVSYKLNNNVILRVEDHMNKGYAMPEAEGTSPTASSWNMFGMSVNFIF